MNSPGYIPNENRREFLRGALRYALFGASAALALRALTQPRPTATGQACVDRGLCEGCAVFMRCARPPALAAKHELTGG